MLLSCGCFICLQIVKQQNRTGQTLSILNSAVLIFLHTNLGAGTPGHLIWFQDPQTIQPETIGPKSSTWLIYRLQEVDKKMRGKAVHSFPSEALLLKNQINYKITYVICVDNCVWITVCVFTYLWKTRLWMHTPLSIHSSGKRSSNKCDIMVERSRAFFILSLWVGHKHSPQKVLSTQVCHTGEHQEEMHEEQIQIASPFVILTAFKMQNLIPSSLCQKKKKITMEDEHIVEKPPYSLL